VNKQFVNREEELAALESRYKSGKTEFVVIYGRRRVGKTALILRFMRNKRGVYLLARETSSLENLRRFSERLADHFGDEVLRKNPLRSWDALLEYLAAKAERSRLVVAIDEFPNLVRGSPELPSILQEYLDLRFPSTRLFLIICGSSVGMMERLLGYKSPLYGRRTAQLKVGPLRFQKIRGFFPRYEWKELVEVYGILGGTPAYLREFSDDLTVERNLLERYLRPESILYRDALFVLREELEDPRNYFAIMEAVARGKTTLGEIINETGLERGTVGKYLSVLRDLGLIRREVPVTESWKSRRGRYYLKDPYFAFWFRFVHPNSDLIEAGDADAALRAITRDFNVYMGWVFELVAREALFELGRRGELPVRFTRVGKWWMGDQEVDIMALDPDAKRALLVEVKWSDLSSSEARLILGRLRDLNVPQIREYARYYGLIAKSIEDEGKDSLREEALVADLGDFSEIFGADN